MKTDLSHLDQYRFRDQEIRFGGVSGHPDFGILLIPSKLDGKPLKVIFSRGHYGWDHVSISKQKKMPHWYDMCQIKELFFEDDEAAMQLHPPKSEWISNHETCLHLFKPVYREIPFPPAELVGVKGVSSEQMRDMTEEQRLKLVDAAVAKMDAPQPGTNLSDRQISFLLDKINFTLMARTPRGHVSGLSREELVDALLSINQVRASDYEQAESRLYRPGSKKNIEAVIIDESHHIKKKGTKSVTLKPGMPGYDEALRLLRRAPNSVVQAGASVRRPDDHDVDPLTQLSKKQLRNMRGYRESVVDRDDPINQMDEDVQSLMDRDRE